MPKKTRKEKLRADKRHVTVSPATSPSDPPSGPTDSFAFRYQPRSPGKTNPVDANNDLAAIRHDIVKTILLAAAAIGVELIIYWKFFSFT